MKPRGVAVFCMGDRGHFQRLRSVFQGLARRGVPTHVFTDARFRSEVESAGAVFADLFADGGVEGADDESWPVPVRYVSFAGSRATAIAARVAALHPSVVLHDTFAVIGAAVAHVLGVPRVNVCSGHNVQPAVFVPFLESHPRVRVSAACQHAVDALRARFGLENASPFSYVSALSRSLNVYGEPPEFLDAADRSAFEPIAFYGSLPELGALTPPASEPSLFPGAAPGDLKLYVSFGTVIWGVRRMEALRALEQLTRGLAGLAGVHALVSLGGVELDAAERAAVTRAGVPVVDYVDQWRLLQEADGFVTHAGLNSVHEAILHGVPMLTYPFGWDQPDEARVCQRHGLALPLVETLMGEVRPEDVVAAIAQLRDRRDSMRAALGRAREWELAVIRGRPAVLDQIVELGA